jgi:hypothetical protein
MVMVLERNGHMVFKNKNVNLRAMRMLNYCDLNVNEYELGRVYAWCGGLTLPSTRVPIDKAAAYTFRDSSRRLSDLTLLFMF